jgi:hypothetical protein
MNVFRTDDRPGVRLRVHVAIKHPVALCPAGEHPSVDTNGTGWRDVVDVVRTLAITLSVRVRRFVCSHGHRAVRRRRELHHRHRPLRHLVPSLEVVDPDTGESRPTLHTF